MYCSEQLNHRDGSGGLVGPGSYLPFVIVRLPCCRGSLDLDGKARHRRQSLLHLGFRFRRLALFRPGLGLALGWAYPSKELVKLCPPPDADVQRREKLCKHDSPVGTQREDAVVQ